MSTFARIVRITPSLVLHAAAMTVFIMLAWSVAEGFYSDGWLYIDSEPHKAVSISGIISVVFIALYGATMAYRELRRL